jgi:hypothetical protein
MSSTMFGQMRVLRLTIMITATSIRREVLLMHLDDGSLSTRRPLTVDEDATVGAAFKYPEGSETEVCKLRAGAGGSTAAILGKHMAR